MPIPYTPTRTLEESVKYHRNAYAFIDRRMVIEVKEGHERIITKLDAIVMTNKKHTVALKKFAKYFAYCEEDTATTMSVKGKPVSNTHIFLDKDGLGPVAVTKKMAKAKRNDKKDIVAKCIADHPGAEVSVVVKCVLAACGNSMTYMNARYLVVKALKVEAPVA